ncbi:MAG: TIGR04282 family arsenosugar biosynthesis glycosyltransferase [Proteocatella sp.]
MNSAIILFTRIPIPGKTKTRLEKVFSKEACARLHIEFLKDLNICIEKTNLDCFLFYTPEGDISSLYDIFKNEVSYRPQNGEELGERMYNSIKEVLSIGYESCVLIGSDIPQIKEEDLFEALKKLEASDVVFGPTIDYGYYLVGMKKPHKEVFRNQTYGYGSVLRNTIEAVKTSSLTYSLVKPYLDIDEPGDLLDYRKKVKLNEISNQSFTSKYIEELIEEYRDRWIESEYCENM